MKSKLKILVVEDQQLIREGLKIILSGIPEIDLIGECRNGLEFLEFIKRKMPDVTLMDIKMPVMDGLEAIEKARETFPDMRFIMLTSCDEEEHLTQALNLNVKGYLLKNVEDTELWKAISNVYEGRNYFSNELLTTLSRSFLSQTKEYEEKKLIKEKLTKREIEILYLIVDKGYSNKKIAEACFISPRTAGGHRANILSKTGSKNTPELISNAYKNHIIGADGKLNINI